MRLSPLHPRFGVELHDIDLTALTAEAGYPAIREAFEAHSLLLFRNQRLDDEAHLALGALFGPSEDRSQGKNGAKPRPEPLSSATAADWATPPISTASSKSRRRAMRCC